VRLRAADLPGLAGVERSSRDGDRYELWTVDSDALVRQLVHLGVPFRDLEVATASLEDAFLALTATQDQPRATLTEEIAR
jgi:ABC-2 type transport system ATP-binding protein